MNRVELIGNLTRDPEHRQTPNQISVTTFSIAVKRRFTQGDVKTDFFSIVTWRGLADNCAKYLSKGSKAGVCGTLQTRQYKDKDGVTRYVTEIVADEVEFLTSKSGESDHRERREDPQPTADDLFGDELQAYTPVDDAELPF